MRLRMNYSLRIGCPVDVERHIVCEPCPKHMPINGVFDAGRNEIVSI